MFKYLTMRKLRTDLGNENGSAGFWGSILFLGTWTGTVRDSLGD